MYLYSMFYKLQPKNAYKNHSTFIFLKKISTFKNVLWACFRLFDCLSNLFQKVKQRWKVFEFFRKGWRLLKLLKNIQINSKKGLNKIPKNYKIALQMFKQKKKWRHSTALNDTKFVLKFGFDIKHWTKVRVCW